MRPLDGAAFVVAVILFVVFFANVSIGAVRGTPLFGDVMEMMTLLCASVAFVVGVLAREKERDVKLKTNSD
ncbi:MAG: hypothetical protein KTR21_18290 [Rhodobacteraceae bacterium]|nr:hypothetical protein [Paracoccaceae bacterium]